MSKSLKVFITYSHTDSAEKDKLITCLAVMKREGLISIWHDNEMLGGDKWRDAIFNNLADSDILLYLVSAKSLESENCNKELAIALDEKIKVIPIILEACDWENDQLSDFQAFPIQDIPKKIKPINEWIPESKGWQSVVDGIRKVIKGMQSQKQPSLTITPEEIKILSFSMLQKGNFLMMLKQIDEALKAYSRVIDLNPNDAAAYNNRGVAYLSKDDPDNALADFNKALELDRRSKEAYKGRSIVYRTKKDFDRAIDDAVKLVQLDPSDAAAYCALYLAYWGKGDFENATASINEAIRLKPDQFEFYLSRGDTYLAKSIDNAIEDYNKAIQLNPNFPRTYYNRGLAYILQREWTKAKTDLIRARDMEMDIIVEFCTCFGSIEDFEQETSIQLPEDIAEMLTPP